MSESSLPDAAVTPPTLIAGPYWSGKTVDPQKIALNNERVKFYAPTRLRTGSELPMHFNLPRSTQ